MPRKHDWHPLFWFNVTIIGRRKLPIFLVDDDMFPELRGEHKLGGEKVGLFCPHEWQVLLWAGMPKNNFAEILFHEIAHASADGCEQPVSLINEERALVAMQHRMAIALQKQGWNLPKLPEGWKSLAAHARFLRYGSTNGSNR